MNLNHQLSNNTQQQKESVNKQQQNENGQNGANSSQTIIESLMEFYRHLRNPSSNKLSAIQKQFVDCQKKVLKIVQLRKDIEKSQQIDELKIKYSDQLESMNQKFDRYQIIINDLVKQCHNKENQTLKLQAQLIKIQTQRNYAKKGQSSEGKIFNNIKQSIFQLKGSLQTLNEHSKLALKSNLNNEGNDVSNKKQFIRNKEKTLQSKLQMIKIKQQIACQNEQVNKKYVQSLKQAINVYQDMIKNAANLKSSKQVMQATKLELDRNEAEYKKSCVQNVSWYEKQLMRLKLIIQQQNDQIINNQIQHQNMKMQLSAKKQQQISKLNQIIKQINLKDQRNMLQISKLKEKQSQLQQIAKKLKNYQTKSKEILETKNKQIDNLNKINIQYKQQLEKLQYENIQKKQKIMGLELKITEILAQKSLFSQQQNKSNNEMEILQKTIKQQKKKISNLTKQMKQKMEQHEQIIKLLNQKILKKDKQFANLANETNKKQQNLKTSNQIIRLQNNQLKLQIQSLKQKLHEKNSRERQRQRIEQSITKIGDRQIEEIKAKIEQQLSVQWEQQSKQLQEMMNQVCRMIGDGNQRAGVEVNLID